MKCCQVIDHNTGTGSRPLWRNCIVFTSIFVKRPYMMKQSIQMLKFVRSLLLLTFHIDCQRVWVVVWSELTAKPAIIIHHLCQSLGKGITGFGTVLLRSTKLVCLVYTPRTIVINLLVSAWVWVPIPWIWTQDCLTVSFLETSFLYGCLWDLWRGMFVL